MVRARLEGRPAERSAILNESGCNHLCDLISVGLVDESWRLKLPGELAGRLQSLLDTTDS